MKLNEIHISNYRGFAKKSLKLNKSFNVIAGDNGTGKTSILDACAVALGSFLLGIDNVNSKTIRKRDIHIKMMDGQPKPQLPATIEVNGIVLGEVMNWSRSVKKISKKNYNGYDKKIKEIANQLLSNSREGENVSFPLIAYHGTGRLWTQQATQYRSQQEGVESGYKNCLKAKSNSQSFIEWFKTNEDEINKFNRKEDKVLFNAFKSAITSFVKDWTDLKYSYKFNQLRGIFKDKNGTKKELSYNQLSDGYKNAIGMVADIVYRCIQLNPHLGKNVITDTEGVVLIDELDLHLHPNWQRNIVNDLKKTFPNLQFICTSHSPFIIQSLQKNELIDLNETDFTLEEAPFKQSIEDVAETIMHVKDVPRSRQFLEMIEVAEKYYTLVKKGENNAQNNKEIIVGNEDMKLGK